MFTQISITSSSGFKVGKKHRMGYDVHMDSPNNDNYPRYYSGYTLLESIGQGGMSAIDLAQTTVTDAQYVRFVVIKRMHAHLGETDDSYIRMFQDEARISAELQHENIAQVYNFGQFDSEFFMVMEYVPGLDLRELQKGLASQGKGIPIRITLKILYDILQALDYAHHRVDTFGQSLNIVHRDVNPRNVMLSIRGEVKLIDFGVAKADNRMDHTVGHTIKGKFAYMAPEQIDPSVGTVDGRADLFAVGLMLYELVAGRRPFFGLNEIQIMHKIMSADIPDLPKAPDHPEPELLQSLFNVVRAQSPDDRFGSAGEMAQAVYQAGIACGGMASTAELAQFLKDHMPERVAAIGDRLTQYKTHATLTSPTQISIPSVEYADTTNPSAATTLKRERPSTLEEEHTITHTNHVRYGWMALGGLLLFGIGFATITQLGNTPSQPQLSPTQVISESTQQTKVKAPVAEPIEKNDNKEESTKPSVRRPIESSPSRSTVKVSTEKVTPSKSTTTKATAQPSLEKRSAATTGTGTITTKESTPKPNTSQPSSSAKTIDNASSEKKTKGPTPEPTIATHTLYLMVGVDSGTRGLPVLYKGREITQTGAKKSVTLPLGTFKIEIQDPKNGTSIYQSITVRKGEPILTVQVHRM